MGLFLFYTIYISVYLIYTKLSIYIYVHLCVSKLSDMNLFSRKPLSK